MSEGTKSRNQLLQQISALEREVAQLRVASGAGLMEKAVRRSDDRSRALLDVVPCIIVEVDADLVYTWSNRAGYEFFGDDVIGKQASYYFVGSQDTYRKVQPLFKGNREVIYLESWQRRKDGVPRLMTWLCRVLRDEERVVTGAFLSAHDITDRHRSEMALRDSEAIMRSILENTLDGIVTIDEKGSMVAFNKTAEKLFGYEAGEVLGRNVSMLMPSPFHEEHDGYLRNYLQTGKAKVIGKGREVPGLRKDGTTFPFFLSIGPAVLLGDQKYFTGMIRDLSSEKQVKAQLRQAQKMESIGTLAGGIAHDFNNILGGIMGYAELILEDADEDSYLYEDIKEMLQGCNRAKALVQQILTFSRQDKPKRELLYLQPLIKESLKLLRATLPTTIDIRQDIDPDCGPVFADATQIHQVIMNICTNAYHAMMERGGVLDVSLKPRQFEHNARSPQNLPFGPYLALEIKDTGYGMDEETRARIFDPFFTTKTVGEGTGMGLAVVHGIVENHGGAIHVTSRPGEGSSFTVFFPVRQAVPEKETEPARETPKGKGHLLLVDDDQFLLKAQRKILERQGFHVTTYSNGVDALLAFQADPKAFRMVITDQTMPQMTGMDLAKKLLELRPDLPIILTTGFSELVTPDKIKAAGIRDLMMKPISKRDFAETIQRILEDSPEST